MIIARNEAHNLPRCLASVQGWVAEIVVALNDTTDDSEAIVKKFGAIVGDKAEIGCNSVLSPGSIIGRGTVLYPGTQWRGVAPQNSIVKFKQSFEIVTRTTR